MSNTAENAAAKDDKGTHLYNIQIDRAHFKIEESVLTGAQIRSIPQPPIEASRDLFQDIPGPTNDIKIELTDEVAIKDGERFYTAPALINPGLGRHKI